MIRVLHIIKTLNLGGAESNLFNLVTSIDPEKFELHVAYSSEGELEDRFKKKGIKLFKFAQKPHKLKSIASFIIIWRLIRYIHSNKIDIIHTHTFNAHVWGSIAAKLTGCKILEHVHDSRYMDPKEFERRGEKNKQYRFTKFLKNISDAVVVLTEQNYKYILEHRLHAPQKIREIQNGICLDKIRDLSTKEKDALRHRFDIPPDSFVILTPIRFSPEKNLKVLLGILLDVIKSMPDVICIVAGNGPQKENFEAELRAKGAQERIKTIGFYPDIPELLNITDVFLLPSTIELHSIAILEAMGQKVPVVVSKEVGCNDEFITDWQNGVLLDPFNKDGWAEAIIKLLKDEKLRKQIGDKGCQCCIERFDIKNTAHKFEDLYVTLMGV